MNWILFGFKASGKSYFAKRLGLPYIDTDILITQREQMPPSEIVLQKGMGYFRKVEKKIITSLEVQNTVIAVGGGAVFDPENLSALDLLGHLIYLKCPKEVLRTRLKTLSTSFKQEDFEKMYYERKPKYETIPSTWIELDGKTNQEVLEELWQVINLEKSLASPHGASPTAKP